MATARVGANFSQRYNVSVQEPTMMMMMKSLKLVFAFSSFALVRALDVEVSSVKCDDTLPVTADFDIKCKDGATKRCTFGEQITVYGNLTYSGLENSGIQENMGYISSGINLMSLEYTLFTMMAIPLCDDENLYADANNQNECPGDGVYIFSLKYNLPSSGEEASSWLASGWSGEAYMDLYAEPDIENMKIGQCTIGLSTYVTPNEDHGFLQTPSAATTAGIILGSIAVSALLCMYCYCCQRAKKKDRLAPGDDLTSQFRRMYDSDDKKDIPTTIATGADASQAADAKSQATKTAASSSMA